MVSTPAIVADTPHDVATSTPSRYTLHRIDPEGIEPGDQLTANVPGTVHFTVIWVGGTDPSKSDSRASPVAGWASAVGVSNCVASPRAPTTTGAEARNVRLLTRRWWRPGIRDWSKMIGLVSRASLLFALNMTETLDGNGIEAIGSLLGTSSLFRRWSAASDHRRNARTRQIP